MRKPIVRKLHLRENRRRRVRRTAVGTLTAERLFNLNGGVSVQPTIQNSVLRNYLERAQAYQVAIKELTRQSSTSFNRGRMNNLTGQVDHWYNSLFALVQQVEAFQQNALLQQDLARVPQAIDRLETELAAASSPRPEQALERTLHNRRLQLDSLQNLEATMQWAELKVESTVSMLGSIYSQAVMSQSKNQVADYRRLLDDIEEEARSLDDYVAVLAEIKLGAAAV